MSQLVFGFLLSFSPYLGPVETSFENYLSGEEVCQIFPSLVAQENGAFLEVPLDHADPRGPKLKLYYRFEVPFRPELPTVVIFNGGPGQGSHFGFLGDLDGFNVLQFDPRGVSCSRPNTYEDYRRARFYSSQAIAKDIEILRQHLKISSWSLYGISYGTVPATIYASNFPEATKVLVLEGVVYEGGDELWSGAFRRRVLERHLTKLSASHREKIISVSQDYNLHPSWLSLYARYVLSLDQGEELLLQRLQTCTPEQGCDAMVREFKTLFMQPQSHPLYGMDNYVHSAIACQELGFASESLTLYDELLPDGSFKQVPGATQKVFCDRLTERGKVEIYRAHNYPLQVPVVYFQGLADGVTQSNQAFLHYREVAKGQAALFMDPKGGHSPNLMKILKGNGQQRSLFLSILAGDWHSVESESSAQAGSWILHSK